MLSPITKLGRTTLTLLVGAALTFSGCTSEPAAEPTNTSTAAPAAAQAAPVPALLETNDQTWTPEALEDLLAPVALYPDEVLGQVLVAATNPQEVLDAGTWRLKNESLEAKALDDAAQQAGFTPPVRVLIQNPVVLDMMCSEFGWTQELGQAYVNDQDGVLAAIQRLRVQARDAGTLVTSDKMLVEVEAEAGEQAIYLSSPDPDVVYVPQYEPQAVYAPLDDDDDDGVGTGTVVATALLAFGAGLALGAIFDDDDDDWYDDDYYYPSYYGRPMPYYAHYPYRPVYAGYYPATFYARPPAYRYAYTNTTIVRRDVDNYWVRYDDRAYVRRDGRATVSPISSARPNRPELQYLNEKSKRGPARRAPAVTAERDRYQTARQESAVRAEKRKTAKADRRVKDVDRGDRAGGRDVDRDRASKAGGQKRDRPDAGGGGDRTRTKSGGSDRERPKAGGGGGDRPRPKAGGGGGDRPRPKASGGGGDRPKPRATGGSRPSGSRSGGGRRRG